jgi:ATP/maltotriose-dependent transcriptional regulator MalT
MVADARNRFKELGLEVTWAGSSVGIAFIERYAGGDPAAAEPVLREGCEALERMGERSFLSTNAAMLAQTLCDLGRHEEAESWTRLSEEAAASDDQASQVLWRSARAKIVARRGELDEAERLAREAVALATTGDAIPWTGEALLNLSEVLRFAGKNERARVCLEGARALFGQKGVLHMAERTGALLADLPASERTGRVPA